MEEHAASSDSGGAFTAGVLGLSAASLALACPTRGEEGAAVDALACWLISAVILAGGCCGWTRAVPVAVAGVVVAAGAARWTGLDVVIAVACTLVMLAASRARRRRLNAFAATGLFVVLPLLLLRNAHWTTVGLVVGCVLLVSAAATAATLVPRRWRLAMSILGAALALTGTTVVLSRLLEARQLNRQTRTWWTMRDVDGGLREGVSESVRAPEMGDVHDSWGFPLVVEREGNEWQIVSRGAGGTRDLSRETRLYHEDDLVLGSDGRTITSGEHALRWERPWLAIDR